MKIKTLLGIVGVIVLGGLAGAGGVLFASQQAVTEVTVTHAVKNDWAARTSSGFLAQKATVAPSSTNACTMARPMPFVPPVTSTVLPSRPRSMTLVCPTRPRE